MKTNKKFIQLFLAVFSITIMVQYAYAADSPPIGQTTIPSGQTSGSTISANQGIDADILGQKGGIFHPFLILEEIYTDNLFATHSNTKSSFITTIAPGIWLALPGTRKKLLSIDTTTTSPGGLRLSRIKPDIGRLYQAYLLYSPEYVMYSKYSGSGHFNHKAEGLFQLNFNSGLSFDLIDLFHDKEEIAGNGITDTLYRYQDNLINFITTYDPPSNGFKMELAYSNYFLDYEDNIVSYRNRVDNSYGASVFYKFWPKTALFAEYNYSDIEFDTSPVSDSIENRYYGGIQWDMTAKTRGTAKLGYMEKDFDSTSVTDQDGISFELQTQHFLTPRRTLEISGYRKFHESDMAAASSFLSIGFDIGLSQKFTEKWSGTLNGFYERNSYHEISRNDDVYGIGPAIRFEPREWMFFDLGYYYHLNSSNLTTYDYDINQFFFRATLSM